jgi:prefoldin alpha subunit
LATNTQQAEQRELMMLQQYLKDYGQQAEIFVEQLNLLENARMEAMAAIESLEAMVVAEDNTVLLQIGGGQKCSSPKRFSLLLVQKWYSNVPITRQWNS